MSRKPRNIYSKGFFHIIVQGINKSYIFQTYNQKNKFKSLIKKYKNKCLIKIISYCIMDNHAHFIIYCDNIKEISNYMKYLNSAYGIYYNKTNQRVGFVYRNRYQSQFIYNMDYLKRCIKYIHMNPVKANIVQNQLEYKFSSYREFIFKNCVEIIDTDIIQEIFNNKDYKSELLKVDNREIEVMDIDREAENYNVAVKNYLEDTNTNLKEIKKDRKKVKLLCENLKTKGYKQKQIANLLEVSRYTVSRILKS